jgi:deoxyribodipyrimidine photo-lyase
VATAEVAAKVDEDPPLNQLTRLLDEKKNSVDKGESVVYWMRMDDMRSEWSSARIPRDRLTRLVEDNTALSQASDKAKQLGVPVVALFVISPGDYRMHDRSARRIDFMLRNLRHLKVGRPSSSQARLAWVVPVPLR